ncbi:MAG: hypothetical protein R3202_10970, partial [Candidatus Competibacterales bacterium]|nr:hypothetical protein [Candidatus Competibacterales bacterium]
MPSCLSQHWLSARPVRQRTALQALRGYFHERDPEALGKEFRPLLSAGPARTVAATLQGLCDCLIRGYRSVPRIHTRHRRWLSRDELRLLQLLQHSDPIRAAAIARHLVCAAMLDVFVTRSCHLAGLLATA